MTTPAEDERIVTVCAECLCASCWHGEFLCQKSWKADITKRTVRELRALDHEHPDYYSVEKCRANGTLDQRFA